MKSVLLGGAVLLGCLGSAGNAAVTFSNATLSVKAIIDEQANDPSCGHIPSQDGCPAPVYTATGESTASRSGVLLGGTILSGSSSATITYKDLSAATHIDSDLAFGNSAVTLDIDSGTTLTDPAGFNFANRQNNELSAAFTFSSDTYFVPILDVTHRVVESGGGGEFTDQCLNCNTITNASGETFHFLNDGSIFALDHYPTRPENAFAPGTYTFSFAPGTADAIEAPLPPHALHETFQFTVEAVPEPASWAMMIGGFGLVGGVLRAARRSEERFTRRVRRLAEA